MTRAKRIWRLVLAAGGAGLLACGPGAAPQFTAGRAADEAPRRPCISVERLRRSEIVDNRTIRFHLIDGVVVRSDLSHPCYGLLMQGGFGFVSSTAQLCQFDLIRVLGSGSVCQLGPFAVEVAAPDGRAQPPAGG